MHYIYELKKRLIDELEEHGEKNDLSSSTLHEIDTLAHAAKNLCKVIESCEEEEMSGRSYGYEPMDRMSSRRDAMGRFSRDGRMSGADRSMDGGMGRSMDGMSNARGSYGGGNERVISQLEDLMRVAGDDRTRGKFRELIRDMRNG